MAPDAGAAAGDQRAKEGGRAGFDRQRDPGARDALGGDALAHATPSHMRQARGAPMRLVKMNMAVDEGGPEEPPPESPPLTRQRRRPRRTDRRAGAGAELSVRREA